jgi:hypothetical protein
MDFPIIPVVDIDIPFVNPQAKALDIERFSASTLIFLFGLQEPLTSYVLPVNGLYSAKMRTATTSRTHGPSPGSHRGLGYNLAWMAIVKLAIVDMYRD